MYENNWNQNIFEPERLLAYIWFNVESFVAYVEELSLDSKARTKDIHICYI